VTYSVLILTQSESFFLNRSHFVVLVSLDISRSKDKCVCCMEKHPHRCLKSLDLYLISQTLKITSNSILVEDQLSSRQFISKAIRFCSWSRFLINTLFKMIQSLQMPLVLSALVHVNPPNLMFHMTITYWLGHEASLPDVHVFLKYPWSCSIIRPKEMWPMLSRHPKRRAAISGKCWLWAPCLHPASWPLVVDGTLIEIDWYLKPSPPAETLFFPLVSCAYVVDFATWRTPLAAS